MYYYGYFHNEGGHDYVIPVFIDVNYPATNP